MKRWPILCVWCRKPNDRYAQLCYDCHDKAVEWQAIAGRQVAVAVKTGALPPPYKFRCVDCTRRATVYDHGMYPLTASKL